MSESILVIGLMVFFAHFLTLQFRKTNIPDVLVLMLVGILIGPVLGIVTPEDFGKIGSLIATIALVLILFESGTSLDINVLAKSLTLTGKLAIGCFTITAAIATLTGIFVLELALLPATILGLTLGSTSPAVIIPLVNALKISEKPATVLILESALTDVLSIIGVFALLQIYLHGDSGVGHLIGGVMSAMIFAAVIGVMGGIGWLLVLGKLRDFPNTISSTLAFVFIVYGTTEVLGFSGAIASLALGVTLSNFKKFRLHYIPSIDRNIVPLNDIDHAFYREAVFLLRTYFFVYLGISIHFSDAKLALTAVAMVLLIYIMRIVMTRTVFRDPSFSLRDSAITSMMAPKGLAAAVLASLPLQFGVEGGEIIRDTTYMVVLVSITLTALLVMAYPSRSAQSIYSRAIGKPHATPSEETPPPSAP